MSTNPQTTDPFLAFLDEQLEGEAEPWRREAILSLYECHYTEPKTPFLATSAMVSAGLLGIAAPMWAVKLFKAATNDRITSPDIKSLDIALGFKGEGTGKTKAAEVPQRVRKNMLEVLCQAVHKLVIGGLSKTEACRQVAKQVKALFRKDGDTSSSLWTTNCYGIKPPNADTMLRQYRKWEKHLKHIDEIAASVTPGETDLEDFSGLINKYINVLQCFLANPSQQPDEATLRAFKKFFDSLQPPSANSHT